MHRAEWCKQGQPVVRLAGRLRFHRKPGHPITPPPPSSAPAQQTLPLHDMLRGAIPGSPFLVKGELLFSVVLTPLKLNGSFQSALDAPPGLAHAASPLLRCVGATLDQCWPGVAARRDKGTCRTGAVSVVWQPLLLWSDRQALACVWRKAMPSPHSLPGPTGLLLPHLCRRWAYKHMPRDRRASWGSEGFPSRRLPDTPGDECATLGQASLCLFDAYASLAKGDEACSACGGSCAAEPAASSRREDSGDEADMTLSEVVAKAKQTLARRQRAEELAWWEAALALLWLYLLFRTLRWVLRRLGVGSARAGEGARGQGQPAEGCLGVQS